eukprot:CAMPEP_0194709980 /NCGR_PEP_ID=MMETSP0296-20130528/2643_1 /TAXON_ID=39354 /ORGANISM="Heterosigma akashiwo, Strain CCMP2393" /LENGTH=65 /DNA_ID=CAMNT_0039607481 /DNA_START=36 /DNA_END=230 /DNA_ORIENTATION=+
MSRGGKMSLGDFLGGDTKALPTGPRGSDREGGDDRRGGGGYGDRGGGYGDRGGGYGDRGGGYGDR